MDDSPLQFLAGADEQLSDETRRSPFAVLQRFAKRPQANVERCELCSLVLADDHSHIVEPATRKMFCACQACAILFSSRADTRYRRVPQRYVSLTNFQLTDAQWESLMIPIGLAFFFQSSVTGKVVALYPSPAGATESLLDLDSWSDLVLTNPVLNQMETDTEALLVNRINEQPEYYLLPIDECYKLVGLIRSRWRGLSGGTDLWSEINEFFSRVKERATVLKKSAHG